MPSLLIMNRRNEVCVTENSHFSDLTNDSFLVHPIDVVPCGEIHMAVDDPGLQLVEYSANVFCVFLLEKQETPHVAVFGQSKHLIPSFMLLSQADGIFTTPFKFSHHFINSNMRSQYSPSLKLERRDLLRVASFRTAVLVGAPRPWVMHE
jgi:hypothetical protein